VKSSLRSKVMDQWGIGGRVNLSMGIRESVEEKLEECCWSSEESRDWSGKS
jgi:hypothetical protein